MTAHLHQHLPAYYDRAQTSGWREGAVWLANGSHIVVAKPGLDSIRPWAINIGGGQQIVIKCTRAEALEIARYA